MLLPCLGGAVEGVCLHIWDIVIAAACRVASADECKILQWLATSLVHNK